MRPFQEHETPWMLRVWAERIEVKRVGNELIVVGTNPGKAAPSDLFGLFHRYLFAPNSEIEAKGPHLEFANANSDPELIEFIRNWGPIAAPSIMMKGWSKKNTLKYWGADSLRAGKTSSSGEMTSDVKEAREDFRCVQAIQGAIAAFIALLNNGSASKLSRETVLSAMERVIEALTKVREQFMRVPTSDKRYRSCALGSPGLLVEFKSIYQEAQRKRRGLQVSDLREFCWDMLCALFNRFPDTLVSTTRNSSALPTSRENIVLPVPAEGHGILPLLIFMLRQDVLAGRRVITCERCGEFLLQRRLGERACDDCKEAVRAKRYYEKKKKTILRRRKKKRRMIAVQRLENEERSRRRGA